MKEGPAQTLALTLDGLALGLKCGPADIVHQTQFAANGRQTQIGIVLAQQQAVFGTRGEHAVGLLGTAGNQVIHQHAEIGFIAAWRPRRLVTRLAGSIDTRQQTLCRGLFVAGGAVDLPGEEQPAEVLGLQRGAQVTGIEKIIFNGVTGARNVGLLETLHGTHQGQLHVEGQTGGDAVRIDLVRRQSLRFDEDLVRILVGKAHDLVFNRWAVARAHALDDTAVHRRTIQPGTDDIVGVCVSVGNVAADLAQVVSRCRHKGKAGDGIVARLLDKLAVVDGLGIDAWWRAGLQAFDAKGPLTQAPRQGIGRRITGTATLVAFQANVYTPAQEGAHGQHHCRCPERQPHLRHHAGDAVVLHQQVIHRLLEQLQAHLILQRRAHHLPI